MASCLKKRASSVLLVWVCTKAEEHQNHLSILSDALPGAGEFPRAKNDKFNGVYDVSQKIKGDLYTYIYIYNYIYSYMYIYIYIYIYID